MRVEHVAKRGLFKNIKKPQEENNVFEGFRASGAAQDGARWLQDGYKRGQDELGWGLKVPERQDRR